MRVIFVIGIAAPATMAITVLVATGAGSVAASGRTELASARTTILRAGSVRTKHPRAARIDERTTRSDDTAVTSRAAQGLAGGSPSTAVAALTHRVAARTATPPTARAPPPMG